MRTALFLSAFSYVCPEPVLVNVRVFSIKWRQKGAVKVGTFREQVRERGRLRKSGLFEPFMYINAHFTRTGSGQAYGKLKKGPFLLTAEDTLPLSGLA